MSGLMDEPNEHGLLCSHDGEPDTHGLPHLAFLRPAVGYGKPNQ